VLAQTALWAGDVRAAIAHASRAIVRQARESALQAVALDNENP
jgi:hypothetical protein